jgi:3',5'-cyclic AMP phosphodiesterase CpdA
MNPMKQLQHILLPLLSLILIAFIFALSGDVLSKQTAPSQNDSEKFRFITFGDFGTGDSEQYDLAGQMLSWRKNHPFDTVLLLGDNIYNDGDPADIPAKFEKPYAELLKSGIKFYAVLGNHDVRKGREGQINYPNFNMGGRSYYSFTKGNGLVEFFAIDSTNFDDAQSKWLEGALAASKAQWKLAFFHHPIYSSAKTHGSDTKLRAKLEPMFQRYGVAAAFSGHDHTYERTRPQNGIQYFVAGAGSGKLRKGDLDRKSSIFEAGNDESGSFLFVEVTREALSFEAINASGTKFDSAKIQMRKTAAQ